MYQKYTFYKSIVKLPSLQRFSTMSKLRTSILTKKEKVLDERNFVKKSLTLGVRVVGEDVGRNILIKGDSVQQFATIICRKKRVKFNPKKGEI